MKTYTYLAPKIKLSTKLVEVLDEYGKSVCKFKRSYKNSVIRIANFLLGNDFFVQYHIFSNNEEWSYSGRKIPKWSRAHYLIKNHKTSQEFYISYSNGPIAPDLLVQSDEMQFTVKQIHSEWIKFYYQGIEIARWKMAEFFKVYLEIETNSPIQEPEFFICICQCIFYIGG